MKTISPELHPRLTPIIDPWVQAVLTDKERLVEQFARYSSPLNIHALQPFAANYALYRQKLEQYRLRHLVLFARKANKCQAFVQEANRLGFGVDTASYRELNECLELGCRPDRLVLTGAIKDERLVRLAVQNNVLIILDNLDECRLVQQVAQLYRKPANVGVRIGGFTVEGQTLYSRFGFLPAEVVSLVSERFGSDNEFSWLQYRGLHFHLNGYSRRQRGAALLTTIECSDALSERGITTTFIDIGGGFLVQYLEDKQEWEHFFQELNRSVQGLREPITFENNGLGLTLIDGLVRGTPTVYPYYNETAKEKFLEEILLYEDNRGQTTASLLRERNIELRLEPGRSLLDQAGVTIARVAFRKWDSRGDLLVGLEMNRTQLMSSSADFLLDPILVSNNRLSSDQPADDRDEENPIQAQPVGAYLVGAYCLEQDIVLKRKMMLDRVPLVGDLVCFINTAGYMMHFFESEAHLFELATNLIAHPVEGQRGRYRYERD